MFLTGYRGTLAHKAARGHYMLLMGYRGTLAHKAARGHYMLLMGDRGTLAQHKSTYESVHMSRDSYTTTRVSLLSGLLQG